MKSKPATGDLARDVLRLREMVIALGRRRSLRDPIAAACEKIQLTAPQTHAIIWLGHGAQTMGELARHVGMTEKTSTGVVDRLEREGWVQRERDGQDRRVVHVTLTRKGQGIFKRLDQAMTAHMREVLGLLDPADRVALFAILDKLLGRLPAQAGASLGAR